MPPEDTAPTARTTARRLRDAAGACLASLPILVVLAGGAAAMGLGAVGPLFVVPVYLLVLAGLVYSAWTGGWTGAADGLTAAPPRRG